MPKLWNETIEAHRQDVRDAIIEATSALVEEHGLVSVTMSQVAEATGIGRATLYKYFSDIEAILLAWHHRQITVHLEYLAAVRDRADEPRERLEAVLEAYALISYESRGHHESHLAALLHHDEQVVRAEGELRARIQDLLASAAEAGDIRGDVGLGELANFCIHALNGARAVSSKAAVRRLVSVTMTGLRTIP